MKQKRAPMTEKQKMWNKCVRRRKVNNENESNKPMKETAAVDTTTMVETKIDR